MNPNPNFINNGAKEGGTVVDVPKLQGMMKEKGILIDGGYGKLKGKACSTWAMKPRRPWAICSPNWIPRWQCFRLRRDRKFFVAIFACHQHALLLVGFEHEMSDRGNDALNGRQFFGDK